MVDTRAHDVVVYGATGFVDLRQLLEPVGDGDLDAALDGVLSGLRAAVGGALDDDLAMLVAEYVGGVG